jgi:ABC-type multidrug transport system permease subunit
VLEALALLFQQLFSAVRMTDCSLPTTIPSEQLLRVRVAEYSPLEAILMKQLLQVQVAAVLAILVLLFRQFLTALVVHSLPATIPPEQLPQVQAAVAVLVAPVSLLR